MTESSAFCRVCGFDSDELKWGEDGATPTFDICPCCHVEHGYGDATRSAAIAYRRRWLESGGRWSDPHVAEDRLGTEERLRRVPAEFA